MAFKVISVPQQTAPTTPTAPTPKGSFKIVSLPTTPTTTPPPATSPFQNPAWQQSFNNTATDVLKGAGKGVMSTLKGVDTLARKVPLLGSFLDKVNPVNNNSATAKAITTPTNTAQNVGFGAEQLAEYLLPSTAIGKASKAANTAIEGTKMGGFLQGAAKVATRSGLEGAGAGLVRSAQTGDVKEGAKAAAITAGMTAPFAAAGEIARVHGLPEKLYSQVFKNTADDMTESLRTGALKDLQKTSPELFDQYVKEGIIKPGKNGVVEFDPTLAQQALDRGLRGSIKTMSNEVVRGTLKSEQAARNLVNKHAELIAIPEPDKYVSLLNQVKSQYKGTFLEGRASQAQEFINNIVKREGRLTSEDVFKLRRYLDSMRRASSYRPNPTLSIAQEDFKAATDTLRGVLDKNIKGFGQTMDNYSFYLDALQSLGKEASRRGNQAVINLLDTVLFGMGGGLAGPEAAVGFPMVRRYVGLPSVLTTAGTKIEQGTKGTIGRLFRGGAASILTGNKKE
jgi:hypothetical protein